MVESMLFPDSPILRLWWLKRLSGGGGGDGNIIPKFEDQSGAKGGISYHFVGNSVTIVGASEGTSTTIYTVPERVEIVTPDAGSYTIKISISAGAFNVTNDTPFFYFNFHGDGSSANKYCYYPPRYPARSWEIAMPSAINSVNVSIHLQPGFSTDGVTFEFGVYKTDGLSQIAAMEA